MISDTINDMLTNAGSPEGMVLAGRYRVVRQLGRGGMGSVWLVEDAQLDGRQFAVKMLPSILVNNKRAYRQLKDEALVAMRLSHENIVTLRAFEENDGNPFLVMDYVDGVTLEDYLCEKCKAGSSKCEVGSARGKAGGGISEDEVIRVLKPIAAALDYAHGKGVVHRDVKPGNVMIAKDGTPYILDFGIAREMQETITRVTGKFSSGTLLYMSPEQLMGDPPTKEQDVYSFAAMAYECLKGEPPFSRGNIEFQIMNKQPEPLTGKAAILAAGTLTGKAAILAAGAMAGLAKQPKDRPPTCTAVLEWKNPGRVEHAESVDGVGRAGAPRPQAGRRVPTPPQSGGAHSRGCLAAALITLHLVLRVTALLALIAGIGWWRQSRQNGTAETSGTAETNGTAETSGTNETSATNGTTNTTPVDKPAPEPVLEPRPEIIPVPKPVVITNEVVHVVTNEVVHVVTNEVVRVAAEKPSLPKETPAPMEKPTPAPVEKPTPVPVEKPTPVPVEKSTPVPVEKPTPVPESLPVEKPTPAPIAKPESLPAPAPEVASRAFTVDDLEALDVSVLRPGEGREVKLSCGVVLALNWCPPGEFGMQSPARRVQFPKGFWMGRYEVTQALWNGVMSTNPSMFHCLDTTNAPVGNVSRDDCLRFVAELNRQNSTEGFRLPSDAQWEYACRAGTSTPFHYGATGSLADMCARSYAPQKTGMFKPNAWGLHDMHGNMAEWCEDPYPRELLNFFQRDVLNRGGFVLRGGSYKDKEANCTASSRRREAGARRHPTFGMRLCFSSR